MSRHGGVSGYSRSSTSDETRAYRMTGLPASWSGEGAAGGGPARPAVGANEDIRDDSADVGEVSDNPTLGYPYS